MARFPGAVQHPLGPRKYLIIKGIQAGGNIRVPPETARRKHSQSEERLIKLESSMDNQQLSREQSG
jgi:hypothetical protein